MGPDVTTIDNAATPVAGDFVRQLQGLLDANALDTGAGPLQKRAGMAISNFVDTGIGRLASGGVDPGTQALISSLTENVGRATDRQAADLREAFGAAGTRFGSTLADAEGQMRSDATSGLGQTIGQILTSQHRFNTGALLQAIRELSRQGSANLVPFLELLRLGTPPAENVVSPGVGQQILSGAISAGGKVAGSRFG